MGPAHYLGGGGRMPAARPLQPQPILPGFGLALAIVLLITGVIGMLTHPAWAGSDTVPPIRSRQVELQYRLVDASPAARVELWYTRDRAFTWQRWGVHEDHTLPLVFDAPAEGLYGFLLIVRDGEETSPPPPDARTRPQRWVFVDYTPPLVQWDNVEPADAFASRRLVHLRWTAHDDNLPSRPVALSYHSSVDQKWHAIDTALPNTGRYDWSVPVEVAGRITLRLAVQDLGGHVVERLYGPVPLDRWLASPVTLTSSATQPAAAPVPKTTIEKKPPRPDANRTDLTERRKAEQLYHQGSWHLVRGQYALAAERFREVMETDPSMLAAVNDLAGIYYLQKDYPKAIEHYNQVLKQDRQHQAALRGAALAYVAQRQYAQSRDMLDRLIDANGTDAQAWLDLGDVLFMMGDRDGALSRWGHAARPGSSADAEAVIRKARRRLELYGPTSNLKTADGNKK